MVCSKKVKTASAIAAAASSIYTGVGAAATADNSGIKGFNYGAFFRDYTAKQRVDFEYEFKRAQNLANTTGWNSARLYTMVQHGTASDIISAIPAAISTKTRLLLGLWVSGTTSAITNEIAALKSAIATYGSDFTDTVVGLSVGCEDMFRDAEGDSSKPGVGVDSLISYIAQVRSAIAGTALANVPLGHVDTYDAFENSTNTKLIDYLDWIGFDAYPFWEKKNGNSIEAADDLFHKGLANVKAISGGKPVWVTETGWPVSGDTYSLAVPSAANAQRYWREVACTLVVNKINLWWYILQEAQHGQPNPDFGIFGAGDLAQVPPRYDLSCP